MASEFGSNQSGMEDLISLEDILGVAADPQELAATMSEADIRDLIAVYDEGMEADRDIISKAEARIQSYKMRTSIAQQALQLARDKGLE